MAKAVKIYVVDEDGNSLLGQKVHEYGGNHYYTNKEGYVKLLIEGTKTTIYVNHRTAFNGYTSDLDSTEIFTKTGQRP